MRIPPLRIVLSGGGIRAVAHSGALKALEEKGMLVAVKEYIGLSAGGLIANRLLYKEPYSPLPEI